MGAYIAGVVSGIVALGVAFYFLVYQRNAMNWRDWFGKKE